uniref:Putative secreted protein n=1 Tax=Ixodes ricinus TaxID=34613 RepID=A0A6B0UN93_IXORI
MSFFTTLTLVLKYSLWYHRALLVHVRARKRVLPCQSECRLMQRLQNVLNSLLTKRVFVACANFCAGVRCRFVTCLNARSRLVSFIFMLRFLKPALYVPSQLHVLQAQVCGMSEPSAIP